MRMLNAYPENPCTSVPGSVNYIQSPNSERTELGVATTTSNGTFQLAIVVPITVPIGLSTLEARYQERITTTLPVVVK